MNDATIVKDETIKPQRWWRPHEELAGLNPHLADKLIADGFRTADDLRSAGPEKILAVKGVGKVGLEEIRVWLCGLDGDAI